MFPSPPPDLHTWVRTAREQLKPALSWCLEPLGQLRGGYKAQPHLFSLPGMYPVVTVVWRGRGGKKPHLKCQRLQSRALPNALCSAGPARISLGILYQERRAQKVHRATRRGHEEPAADSYSHPRWAPSKHKARGTTATPLGTAPVPSTCSHNSFWVTTHSWGPASPWSPLQKL